MSTQTTNIKLKIIEDSDDFGQDLINENTKILETELTALKASAEEVATLGTAVATNTTDIASLSTRVTNNANNISTLSTTKEDKSNKGEVNGYASLDSNGKVPVSQIPSGFKEIKVVATIAARDAITGDNLYDGLIVRVLDATGDTTVTSGWAEYSYDATNTAWVKLAEKESMDVVLDWSNVQNIPALLKLLTATTGGKLAYNGTQVYVDMRAVTFVGTDYEISYPWAGTVQKLIVSCSETKTADFVFEIDKQSKADYTAKADNWSMLGSSQLTLTAGVVLQEYILTDALAAGDVLRAATAGDDTGVTFQLIIQNT
jgi:hypothetical protein